jgi:hypothetical protein
LTLKLAPTAEHVPTFVPPKLYTRNSIFQEKSINGSRFLSAPVSFYKNSLDRHFQPVRQSKPGLYGYCLHDKTLKNTFVAVKCTLGFDNFNLA